MTGKRTKRLLSLLLSVLLVAGMLPMGALAAPHNPTGDDYVEVKLMAGDMPGYETNTKNAQNLATWFTKQSGYVTNTTDKTAALAAATAMNNTFQQANAVMEGSTKVADIKVSQDGNFYLAVGFDSSNLKDGKGVGTVNGAPFAFNLAYNIDAFEFVKTNLKGRDDVMAEANPVIGGTLINGTDESWGDYNWDTYVSQDFIDVDMGNNYKVTFTDKHAQSYDGYNATSTPKYGGGANIQFANQNAKAYRLSSQATWTVVMKVHVKVDAAPGLYYFSYPETDTESSIYLLEKNDGTATDFIGINPAEMYRENMKYLKTTDLVVKVEEKPAPGINLKGVAGESTITVTANDYCALATSADPAHWTVKSGTTDGTSGTPVTVSSASAGNGKVTLTLADPLVADTDYYVEAAAAAFAATPAVSNPVKNTFRPGVKPAATYNVVDGTHVTLAAATGCEYRVGTSGTWADAKADGTTDNITITAPSSNGTTNPDATIQVQKKGNTDADLIQSITITRADLPGNYTINYADEKLKFAGAVQYKIGNGSVESGSTTEKAITPGAAAQAFTYWTAPVTGASGKLQSATKSGSIPKRPDNTAALGTTTQAQKNNGQTVLGTAAANTVYFIDAVSDTETLPTDTSKIKNWAAGAVAATTADYIHAYIPATATAFKSAFVHKQGVGNNYGTVTASGASEGTTVTLSIVGDTWAADAASKTFGVQGNTVTNVERTSDSVVTLTVGTALADGNYNVTVPAAATTKNAAVNGGSNVVLAISSTGYRLSSTGLTFAPATHAGGSTTTVTVSGLADYEKLDSISASGFTFEVTGDNTFTISGGTAGQSGTINLDVTTAKKVKALTAADLSASPVTKAYDGTTDAPTGFAVTVTNKYAAKGDVTIAFTSAAFNSKDAATANEITLTGVTLSGDDADYYTVPGTVIISGASITAAAFTGATVTVADTTDNTQAALITALKAATVAMNGVDEGTLGEILSNPATDWAALADTAVAKVAPAHDDVAVTLSGDTFDGTGLTATVDTAPIGANLTFTVPDNVKQLVVKSGAATIVDGKVQISNTAVDGETIVVTVTTPADTEGGPDVETDVTITVTAVTPAEPDYEAALDKALTVTIPAASFDAWADAAIKANYSGLDSAGDVTASVNLKKTSTPPAGGFGVTFNTRDYGEADSTYAQADAEGKITALPKMNKVVKGAQFNGWSKDGTEAGKVDVGTLVVEDNIELIAWFEGYMNGYGYAATRPVKPTASVTRGELLKMLLVASGLYDGEADYSGTTKFTDGNGQWYTPYLICAEKSGKTIIEGYSDGTFKANRPVTRNEAAKMIAGAFGVEVDPNGTAPELKDFNNIEDWAKEFVAALYNNGTVDGRNDGAYHGEDKIQRCEAAKMINIYLGLDDASKDAITQSSQIKNPFSDISKSHWAYAEVMFASLSVPASYYSYDLTMPSGR